MKAKVIPIKKDEIGELVEEILRQKDDFTAVIIVTQTREQIHHYWYADEKCVTLMGMLEYIKLIVYEHLREHDI
jgi:hypothetical protein